MFCSSAGESVTKKRGGGGRSPLGDLKKKNCGGGDTVSCVRPATLIRDSVLPWRVEKEDLCPVFRGRKPKKPWVSQLGGESVLANPPVEGLRKILGEKLDCVGVDHWEKKKRGKTSRRNIRGCRINGPSLEGAKEGMRGVWLAEGRIV